MERIDEVTLEPLNKDNWLSVCRLSVSDQQKEYFTVPNIYWIGISRYEEDSTLFAIRYQEEYVGLIGGGFDPDENKSAIGGINPLMVDHRHQKKGIAEKAVRILIRHLRETYGFTQINIGHRKENHAAGRLYERLGFVVVSETETDFLRTLFFTNPQNEDTRNKECNMEQKNVILETERLILRRYDENDLQDLHEYLSDPEVVKFEPYSVMDLEQAKQNLAWRISTEEMIAVVLKSTGKMIGNVYLGKRDFDSLELGYVFNRGYWGKGYAKESCAALVKWAFDNQVHRIFAECDPDNPNSWRLLETLGFGREAHFVRNVYFWKDEAGNPIWKDTFVYSRVKE